MKTSAKNSRIEQKLNVANKNIFDTSVQKLGNFETCKLKYSMPRKIIGDKLLAAFLSKFFLKTNQ